MPSPPRRDHLPLLAELEHQLEAVLRAVVPADRVAFVNFPNHSNAGDPALWLGASRILRRIGARTVYRCEPRTYDPAALAASRPGAVVLNGGGNFGDLWKGQQGCRERLLADFPDLPTVQLPQSITFTDPANLERNKRLVAAHRDLTLLLRDPVSLAFAEREFDAPARLCPDLAFGLGPQPRAAPPRHEVLWLARQDKESRGRRVDTDGLDAAVLDWLEALPDEPSWPIRTRIARDLNLRLSPRVAAGGGPAVRWSGLLGATYPPIARAWTHRGMSILARGEVVVTDRLHGHILSLLQGIPHVVLDNANGKVRGLVEAFTIGSSLVRWADDPDHAVALAREVLASR